jgi:transcription antitermination factor NusG
MKPADPENLAPDPAQTHWYPIHTKPRQERRALDNLQHRGYPCYLPMFPVQKIRRAKLTTVEESLFPRYLFIQLDIGPKGLDWGPIRSTMGVSRLVRFEVRLPKSTNASSISCANTKILSESHPQNTSPQANGWPCSMVLLRALRLFSKSPTAKSASSC